MAEPAKDVAVIGEDASFSGRFVGKDLVLLGRLEGEIELRGRLRLGPKCHARANVRAAAVEAEGELDGEIRADSMSVMPTARVRGTFLVKRLSVQEGAVVEGSINPGSTHHVEPPVAPPALAPPKAPAPPAAPGAPAHELGTGPTTTPATPSSTEGLAKSDQEPDGPR